MAICERCHRGLSDPVSVKAGLGPVCRAKAGRNNDMADADDLSMVVDLPFDPETMDIICRRDTFPGPFGELSRLHVNIPQAVVHHSPTGFEWGYGGSGPADYALNILALFLTLPHERDVDTEVVCYQGSVHTAAYRLHQEFKREFIATLPKEGGTIHGAEIREWIKTKLAEITGRAY